MTRTKFEELVLAKLDKIENRLDKVEARLTKLEEHTAQNTLDLQALRHKLDEFLLAGSKYIEQITVHGLILDQHKARLTDHDLRLATLENA